MRYRKKPVIVEATQWFHPADVRHVPIPCVRATGIHDWVVDTIEGTLKVSPGDWIITGVRGEHYPCKPDIFEATYEQV